MAEKNKKTGEALPVKGELVADSREEGSQRKNDAMAPHMKPDDAMTKKPSTTAYPYFARYGYRDISRKQS